MLFLRRTGARGVTAGLPENLVAPLGYALVQASARPLIPHACSSVEQRRSVLRGGRFRDFRKAFFVNDNQLCAFKLDHVGLPQPTELPADIGAGQT